MNEFAPLALLLIVLVALSLLYIAARLDRPRSKTQRHITAQQPAPQTARQPTVRVQNSLPGTAYAVGPPKNLTAWASKGVPNDAEFRVEVDKQFGAGTYENIIHPK